MRTLEQRYRAAEATTQWKEKRLVRNADVLPNWLAGGDRFWYARETAAGREWMLVDARRRTRAPAFDHARLAQALGQKTGQAVDAAALPLAGLHMTDDGGAIEFAAFGKGFRFGLADGSLSDSATASRTDLLTSPDGRLGVFRRGHNLWIRDLSSGAERALTSDGVAGCAYGAPPECRERLQVHLPPMPAPPEARWSPDGKRLLTLQTDERQVRPLPVLEFVPVDGSLRPKAHEVRVAWPGDPALPEFRMVAIEVATGHQVPAQWPRLAAVRMFDTPFSAGTVWWSDDGVTCWFVDVERGERTARVVAFDTRTGQCRELFAETSATYVDLGYNVYAACPSTVLPQHNELLWWSQRSGHGHLYLVDLASGALKRPVTCGEWLVNDVLHVDAARREVWIVTMGRVPGHHPYHREICRVHLDDGRIDALTPEDGDHCVWRQGDFALLAARMLGDDPGLAAGLAPTGEYFVDTFGTIDRPPQTVLRDRAGQVVMEIERAQTDELPASFTWPEVVETTSADGVTKIFGVMVRPPEAVEGKPLPVVNVIYGGPQIDAVPKTTFAGFGGIGFLAELLAYAQLGFVAVMFEGRGTPGRGKAFQDASYGRIETASDLSDHVAGIRELAARHAFIDLDRVGVTGFSGGGYATVGAMLREPGFYKVGVASAGNHDQRMFWAPWGERYQGLLDGGNYEQQTHEHLAHRLEGRLLLIHGLLDAGCHPSALFRLTEALSHANKDFELLLSAQAAHRSTGYASRRSWDFFMRHLAGLEPPRGLAIETGSDLMFKRLMAQQAEALSLVSKAGDAAEAG